MPMILLYAERILRLVMESATDHARGNRDFCFYDNYLNDEQLSDLKESCC